MSYEADRTLAQAMLRGDEKAFNRFFDDYFPRVFRFACVRLDSEDEELIKDIVQTTMTNAIKGLKGYRGEAALFTWLCQICRNEINAYYRKLSRSVPEVAADDEAIRPILESLEAEASTSPGAQYESLQTRRLIQEVMDFLPNGYGDALEWKYIQGLSVSEIASRLEVTDLAAQSLLARARSAFREAIIKISPQLASPGGAA